MRCQWIQRALLIMLGVHMGCFAPSSALAQSLDAEWITLERQALTPDPLFQSEQNPGSETRPESLPWFDLSPRPFEGSPELAAGIAMLFPGAGYW